MLKPFIYLFRIGIALSKGGFTRLLDLLEVGYFHDSKPIDRPQQPFVRFSRANDGYFFNPFNRHVLQLTEFDHYLFNLFF